MLNVSNAFNLDRDVEAIRLPAVVESLFNLRVGVLTFVLEDLPPAFKDCATARQFQHVQVAGIAEQQYWRTPAKADQVCIVFERRLSSFECHVDIQKRVATDFSWENSTTEYSSHTGEEKDLLLSFFVK